MTRRTQSDINPVDVPRRAALQSVLAVGGLWFLPMAGCMTPRPPTPVPPAPSVPPHPPDAGSTQQENTMPSEYTLPALPYGFDALEPYMDAQTLKLHHDLHHAGYVKGANAALSALESARKSGNFDLVDHHSTKLAFHTSGHLLHSLFWENMAPAGKGGAPSKELDAAIRVSFGNLDAFKAHLSAAAKSVDGSGWGILGFNPFNQRLTVLQSQNHENKAIWSVVPILVVDVWEHAYYLKYQNRRGDFIAAWWNLVNWSDVSVRYAKAKTLQGLK